MGKSHMPAVATTARTFTAQAIVLHRTRGATVLLQSLQIMFIGRPFGNYRKTPSLMCGEGLAYRERELGVLRKWRGAPGKTRTTGGGATEFPNHRGRARLQHSVALYLTDSNSYFHFLVLGDESSITTVTPAPVRMRENTSSANSQDFTSAAL